MHLRVPDFAAAAVPALSGAVYVDSLSVRSSLLRGVSGRTQFPFRCNSCSRPGPHGSGICAGGPCGIVSGHDRLITSLKTTRGRGCTGRQHKPMVSACRGTVLGLKAAVIVWILDESWDRWGICKQQRAARSKHPRHCISPHHAVPGRVVLTRVIAYPPSTTDREKAAGNRRKTPSTPVLDHCPCHPQWFERMTASRCSPKSLDRPSPPAAENSPWDPRSIDLMSGIRPQNVRCQCCLDHGFSAQPRQDQEIGLVSACSRRAAKPMHW